MAALSHGARAAPQLPRRRLRAAHQDLHRPRPGEAIGGDVPAPEQARRAAGKAADERRDLLQLLAPLPASVRDEITTLWDEYETALSAEARLAKALDKLETILQHTQGNNPADFDYRFNLTYGRQYTGDHPLLAAVRVLLDEETERRAREAEGAP